MEPGTVPVIRSLWPPARRCYHSCANPRPRRAERTWPANHPLGGRWYWYVVAIGLPLVIHGLNVVINQWVGIGIPRQDFSSIAGWLLIFGVRLINPVNGPVGNLDGADSPSPAYRRRARR